MEIANLKYAAEGSYPEVTGIRRNCCYAAMLQNDYGGYISETSAVLQYIYQHYVVGTFQKDMAKVLKRIAITEMHHHELLGEMILALGGNPIIISTNHQYWDGRFLNYTNNLCKMLTADISAEKQAIANYERDIRVIKDPRVVEIIVRIIADEKVHLATCHELLQQASQEKYC